MHRQRALTLLRWIAVMPAAAAGAVALKLAGGLIARTLRDALGANSDSNIAFALQLLVYAATGAVFVLAGTYAAPTRRRFVASVLAAMSVLLSLLTHIVSQPHPGATNYLHLAAETCGAVVGIVCVMSLENRTRTRGAAVIETDP